jgi:hypothetical protein
VTGLKVHGPCDTGAITKINWFRFSDERHAELYTTG